MFALFLNTSHRLTDDLAILLGFTITGRDSPLTGAQQDVEVAYNLTIFQLFLSTKLYMITHVLEISRANATVAA